jgi:prepilin-type N-terminal cleavage/methylation domain-containing protein/prepilin-type processing-associated H-X9-DG protein
MFVNHTSRATRRAFTLIEVLVVVAIMALLMSILLPSLSGARALSKATVCGTQMNELFKATLMYTQSNDDRLPYFGWYDRSTTGAHWWITQVAPIIGNQYAIYKCPVEDNPYQMQVTKQKGRLVMSDGTEPQKFMMDLTYRSACDTLEVGPKGVYRARKITSWKHPYSALLMVEANCKVDPPDPKKECFRFQDDLKMVATATSVKAYPWLKSWLKHLNKTNFLFVDGHVERLTPKQAAALALKQEYYLP